MDHLSNLPDELLCHIMSFLTTKEAALISVLSKRWRNLIAFVPNLDIFDCDILHWEVRKEERDDIRQLFMDFVDRVLALQGNSPLKKFSLCCGGGSYSDRVDCWIQNVMVRGVSELYLSMIFDTSFHMYPQVFENKKLNFEIFLHALPALEELVMNHTYWKELDVNVHVSVSSASLKTLTIKCIVCLHTMSFDTPSLAYLSYSDYAMGDYPVAKMENLFEARISLFVPEDDISRLMNSIRNVRYLYFSRDTLEVLSLCCESMPVFKNLKSLSIKSVESRGWQAMPVLLRNCPHLETLVLETLLHHVTDKCGDACDCVSREEKGRSLKSCPVKVLKIQEFQGTMKEMHMIKHFLDYLPCLKETKIFYMKKNDRTTQLRVIPEVPEVIAEMVEHYNKLSNCNVQLVVSS
ncbi:putative F-box/LRR-repeat protein [Arabidopsis thaliana]